jgi:ATP-dependent Lhr-like helicase
LSADLAEQWFRNKIGEPFDFQLETWQAQAAGRSGLLHAPTGMGKTFAAWLPSLTRWLEKHPDSSKWNPDRPESLQTLWITPLRALATDTEQSIHEPVQALKLPWTVQRRTGDTPASIKKQQRTRLPTCLVTTPESLSVLLSYADAPRKFAGLKTVIVDEWHELMSTKRGTQTELGLARLRELNPDLMTWGLSATLGNLEQAMHVLLGSRADEGLMIHGPGQKETTVTTVLPPDVQRFPWAGHLGIRQLDEVLKVLDDAKSTLLFTNTRSQAEIWFNAITTTRPDWDGQVALHHGSIDRKTRKQVEDRLREGSLRCCVCTSSLDLGVDFSPVQRVIQVASPKGVARMLQRAGRSGHQPGQPSRLFGVPTHALELLDFAAARDAAELKMIESRLPLDRPLDVLVQHLVTIAMGGGFEPTAMLNEVRSTYAYRDLSDIEWQWGLDFVRRGGPTLTAYPRFCRVIEDEKGRFVVASQGIAKAHRMAIGTITSDAMITVRMSRGKRLGTVEESFVGRLRPGDKFVFAGQLLQLVRVHQMTATVKKAIGKKAQVTSWQGSKAPLSTELADAVRDRLDRYARLGLMPDDPPEVEALAPLLELQHQWSALPRSDDLLIETTTTRDGEHWFLFPLQGRLVHEGLATLLAHRLTASAPRTVTATVNDYGLEILSADPLELNEDDWRNLLGGDRLLEDLLASLNSSELARRQFRDIARIAGLINTGYPGESVSSRHLQASSELFFDVFTEFDPENLLLDQARREVLDRQLEVGRLRNALAKLEDQRIVIQRPEGLTPLAFPLWAEHLREQHMSTQSWEERVAKMVARLEARADKATPNHG